MYESFYGFQEKPFNTLPDPDFLYMSKKHEMALTYLEYGLSAQAGFMVLTGEVGSGKTTLINYLIRNLNSESTKVALVFNTNVKPMDLLVGILREWGIHCSRMSKAELYEVLNDFLLNVYQSQGRVILIIDEAQNLPFETLEEIRMISNLNDEKVPLLHIILSGQPNLKDRLNDPKLKQLRQRVTVHYHLDPLDREETAVYIEHRLKSAGAGDMRIFTPDATHRVYRYSEGIPRVINVICDLALVYGFAEQIKPISQAVIETVVEDRKKMGLDFGEASVPAGAVYKPDGSRPGLERKIQELNENVYDLALIIRKMIQAKERFEKQCQRDIKQLGKRIKGLEIKR